MSWICCSKYSESRVYN